MEHSVTAVLRLITYAEAGDDPAWEAKVDVKARHELELADGRRVLLLNDRGYGSTCAWTEATLADVEFQIRTVVGPDEPFDDLTAGDMQAAHWEALAAVAQQHGVSVEGADLQRLKHDVVISDLIRSLVGPRG